MENLTMSETHVEVQTEPSTEPIPPTDTAVVDAAQAAASAEIASEAAQAAIATAATVAAVAEVNAAQEIQEAETAIRNFAEEIDQCREQLATQSTMIGSLQSSLGQTQADLAALQSILANSAQSQTAEILVPSDEGAVEDLPAVATETVRKPRRRFL
jgi:septal ring factor EnvC (AmiA/AmiB activator)